MENNKTSVLKIVKYFLISQNSSNQEDIKLLQSYNGYSNNTGINQTSLSW